MNERVAIVIAELEHALEAVVDCSDGCDECQRLAREVLAEHQRIIKQARLIFLEMDE